MSFFLSLLLVISVFFRSFGLNISPPELFGDEIDVGYQAFSLLKTGRDLYGQALPFYIHSLAEWRAPLLMYATVPSIAIFGNTVWGVRLPEVVFGSLAPIILFLLAYQSTKNKKLSLLSSLSLALLPWHIHYSRAAFEVVILLDLLMLGTLLYAKKSYFLSIFFFALSFYTYSTAAVFVPLWSALLFFSQKSKPKSLFSYLSIIILIPYILSLFSGHAQERFSTLSIFGNSQTIDTIANFRKTETSPIFHNKLESYLGIFATNYFRSFSTDFLFVRGDPTMRHSLQYIGQLLPLTAPFLVLGLFWLGRKRYYFWLVWLALAPIPAALTIDGSFHATRLFLMIPPLAVAIGAGFSYLRKSLLVISCLILSVEILFVGHYYLDHYPKDSWRWWHVGYQQMFASLPSGYSRYFINNTYEPSLIRYLFYTSYSPARFQMLFSGDKPLDSVAPHYNGFTLDGHVFFGTFAADPNKPFWDTLLPDSVYVVSQRDNVPGNWDWRTSPPAGIKLISTIANPFNEPIFYVIAKN